MNAAQRQDAAGATERFAGIAVALAVANGRWLDAGLGDVEGLAHRCFAATAEAAGVSPDVETEIGLTLADDVHVQALNAEWRGKDKPTNVLSFPLVQIEPGEAPGPMLGDLVLALETLEREALAEGKTLRDHFCHLIVHGMLHCLGHDHETDAEATAMEGLETAVLSGLGIADPYRDLALEEEPIRA